MVTVSAQRRAWPTVASDGVGASQRSPSRATAAVARRRHQRAHIARQGRPMVRAGAHLAQEIRIERQVVRVQQVIGMGVEQGHARVAADEIHLLQPETRACTAGCTSPSSEPSKTCFPKLGSRGGICSLSHSSNFCYELTDLLDQPPITQYLAAVTVPLHTDQS